MVVRFYPKTAAYIVALKLNRAFVSPLEVSMRKSVIVASIAVLSLAATFSLLYTVRGQGLSGPTILSSEAQDENRREIEAPGDGNSPQQPAIGFIDSPSATCYQPNAARDECRLTWYYLSVDAIPNYIITMTLSLNDRGPVAHSQGFFQTSMYIPYSMLGDGIQVACGELGAGGNPELGNAYAYTIRARDSAGLKAANYGTTYCPAYQP